MSVTEKKLENSRIELEITIPVEKVEIEYKSVFDSIKKNVKIDGFRKGKAPLPLVEQRYQERADQDVAENLLKMGVLDAVNEKQLTPLVQPEYQFDRISREEPFSFKAIIEVPPTVELGKYKDIAAEEQVCKLTDEDIDFEIDSLRERDAKFDKKGEDGVIVNGDLAKIRIKRIDDIDSGDVDKVDFKDYSIVVGKSKDESAIDKSIIGMKVGEEKEVEVKYPKGYYMEELAGQKVKYIVVIDEISDVDLPALDDEFAKKMGNETVDELVKNTRENVEKFIGEKARGEAKAHIIRTIVEGSKFDLPESMILNEMGSIFRKTQERVGYFSENIEEFAAILGMESEAFKDKLREESENSIKTTLTLMEIAKKEEITADEDKYREVIESLATRNNKSVEEIEELIMQSNSREKIESELILDKTMDFIYEHAKIKKLKAVTFDEFIKKVS